MSLNRTNIVLATLLAIVVVMVLTSRIDYTQHNIEILPDMKYSPAWSSYEQNPVFANGQTLQSPVPGTIARNHLPFHFQATKEDAIRAGEELQNPYVASTGNTSTGDASNDHGSSDHGSSGGGETGDRLLDGGAAGDGAVGNGAVGDRETGEGGSRDIASDNGSSDEGEAGDRLLDRGAAGDGAAGSGIAALVASRVRGGETYRVFCISCHGSSGAGDGPVAQRGFPPPPSLLTGNSLKMKDGQLFHIVTYGQGSMPGFAPQLTPAERWDAVNYIRSLQPAPPPPDTASPPTVTPNKTDQN